MGIISAISGTLSTVVMFLFSFSKENMAPLSTIMGIMTSVAGGMIRDILSTEIPLVLRKEIYATACFFGSLTYLAMSRLALPELAPSAASMLVTLSIRLAAIRWHLSLPLFLSKHILSEDKDKNGDSP